MHADNDNHTNDRGNEMDKQAIKTTLENMQVGTMCEVCGVATTRTSKGNWSIDLGFAVRSENNLSIATRVIVAACK